MTTTPTNGTTDGAAPPKLLGPELATLRGAIDRVDRAIANLLVKRARLAQRVALLKHLHGGPARDPPREREVRDNYARILRPAGWSDRSVDTWLETMILASRDLQQRLHVAIQGGPGSWSEETLQQVLPAAQPMRCDTVAEAWRACRTGAAVAAWLPVANSHAGPVPETQGVAAEAEGWLEVEAPIRHALLARPALGLADLRRVEGHPHALAQCRATLARLVPQAELVPTVDGAHSAATLPPDAPAAVVGSRRLAQGNGWRVLHEGLADAPDNRTRFRLLLPRETW